MKTNHEIEIGRIKIGKRHRKQLGNIDALANSIKELGLLQAVVLDKDNTLLGGLRRIKAAQKLGWKRIPFQTAVNASDAILKLKAERDENTQRLDFAPSESVTIGKTLEAMEQLEAKKRMLSGKSPDGAFGGRGKKKPYEKFSQGLTGETKAKVGAAVGMSGVTYTRAKKVLEESQKDKTLLPVVKEMDRTGNVNKAFRELKRREHVKRVEEAKKNPKPINPVGPFDIIIADPPWSYEHSETSSREVENHFAYVCPERRIGLLFLWESLKLVWEENSREWNDRFKPKFGKTTGFNGELLYTTRNIPVPYGVLSREGLKWSRITW